MGELFLFRYSIIPVHNATHTESVLPCNASHLLVTQTLSIECVLFGWGDRRWSQAQSHHDWYDCCAPKRWIAPSQSGYQGHNKLPACTRNTSHSVIHKGYVRRTLHTSLGTLACFCWSSSFRALKRWCPSTMTNLTCFINMAAFWTSGLKVGVAVGTKQCNHNGLLISSHFMLKKNNKTKRGGACRHDRLVIVPSPSNKLPSCAWMAKKWGRHSRNNP
jgi:hypothetical protein